MPHISEAMERSVRLKRGGVLVKAGNIVFDSLLGKRQIPGATRVDDVKNSFSSWDNCMAATYCKWPVIIGMVLIGLLIFSIVWCIIRCTCCATSCCCSCFSFLDCCHCCGGCCAGKKDKPHKHLDGPFGAKNETPGFQPQGYPPQGYQAPPPMMGGALPGRPQPPQYAQFEVGKNGLAVEPKAPVNEDALPPMPSWEGASKKHVEEEEKNAVELTPLDPSTGQSIPLMAAAAGPANNLPPSPRDGRGPYTPQPGQGVGGNGYMGVANDPYASQTSFNPNGGYRGTPSPGPGMNGRGQGQFGPPPDLPMGRGYGGPNQNMNMDGNRGYGSPPPQEGYGNEYIGAAIGGDGYGRPPQQRQFSNNSGRPFPPPTRQYSSDSSRPLNPGRQYSDQSSYDNYPPSNPPPRGPSRGPSRGPPGGPPRGPSRGPPPNRVVSPAISNAGFDFGTGAQQPYSRPTPPPQQRSYSSSRSGGRPGQPMRQESRDDYYGGDPAQTYPTRSPPPQEPTYPGYKPYTPPTRGGGTPAPAVLTPGGGRGREPQGWDPVRQ